MKLLTIQRPRNQTILLIKNPIHRAINHAMESDSVIYSLSVSINDSTLDNSKKVREL